MPRAWVYLAGGAALLWWLARRAPSAPSPAPVPIGPPPPPPAPRGWTPVALAPFVELVEGAAYRACVDLPWAIGVVASVEAIKDAAERRGFLNVYVTKAPPAEWGACPGADYYVQGIWGKASQTIARPAAVVGAWVYA